MLRGVTEGEAMTALDPTFVETGQPAPPSTSPEDSGSSTVTFRRVMSRREMAVYLLLLGIALFLTARYAVWWFHLDNVPVNLTSGPGWLRALANYSPFIALSLLEALRVLQMSVIWVFALVMRSAVTMPVPTGLRIAVLTTIVPSKEPISILEATIPAMKAIRHPEPFDVWILDEENDPEVRALCARLGVRHFSRHGIEKYNQPSGPFKARTKAGNHNAWRDAYAADYDVVGQMDPDHIPTEDFLEKTLGYFRDPDVGFIIAPQVYYRNADASWIARGADEANFGFSAITQRGANFLGMPVFIGSNHLARSAALDSVGGYASHIVEDHLTGMEMTATENPRTGNRWKGVYTEDIISLGEGPTRWSSYLSQQLRWAYGLITIVMHQSLPLLRRVRPRQALGFALIQSYYISVAVILTIGITLTGAHLFFGVNAIQVHFDEWFGHFFPQLAISIAIWYWLQRFYLRETDRGWGLRAILVGLGAMVTYTQALALALFRRPLSYVITPKGEVDSREPLRLFRWQLVSLLISLSALVWSGWHSTGAASIKFWAAFNVFQMAIVIVTGVAFPAVLRTPLSWRWSRALGRYTVRVTIPLVSVVVALVVAALIGPLTFPGQVTGTPTANGPSVFPSVTPEPLPRVDADFLKPGSDAVAFGAFNSGADLRVPAKVLHAFIDFAPESTDRLREAVLTAAAEDQVALLTWEPRIVGRPQESARILDRIVAGDLDTYLAGVARVLHGTKQPVMLRFAPEMDQATSKLHPWSGRPPELYINAWRRIHTIFRDQGAGNVLFAWTPGGYFVNEVFVSDDWYPGDRFVDLVGFSAYSFWGWEEWSPWRKRIHAYRSPEVLIGPRYRAIAAHGKPVILPEIGISLHPSRRDEQVAWLRELIDYIDRDLLDLAAIVYFHAHHNVGDWDIDWRLTDAEQRAFAERLTRSDRIELTVPSP